MRRALALTALVALSACAGSAPRTAAVTTTSTTSSTTTTITTTTTEVTSTTVAPTTTSTSAPAPTSTSLVDPYASLPDGNGALIAVVIDDVGGTDAYLSGYLRLGIPLTFAVLPMSYKATRDAQSVAEAGKEVILHIPLPVPPNRTASGGLGLDSTDADVASYLDQALARVPGAVGASNHEGSLGTTDAGLMDRLLRGLQARSRFFFDSVTTQQTLGYATELALGMPPRVNNVFLDNNDTSEPAQLLQLAKLAAKHGSAIGIGHASRSWLLQALEEGIPVLQAKGYRFAVLSQVTNGLAGGLDVGVRTGF